MTAATGLRAGMGRLVSAVALAVLAGACTPTIENRGNLPHSDLLAQIRPGSQTRADVSALLGTPSSTSTFGEEVWYYISTREENYAFFAPKELERTVVAVSFSNDGVVKDVRNLGLEDGRSIEPVARVTPSAGTEMTVLQQLLGNVGRFNKKPGSEGGGGGE